MKEVLSNPVLSGLINLDGEQFGSSVLQSTRSRLYDLYIVYGRIGSGKSTLIEGLLKNCDNLVYFPYDHIYDDAQESGLGLQKPFQNDDQHRIMSNYWLRRLKLFREHIQTRDPEARIIADIPKFRCREALAYLAMGQYQQLLNGEISSKEIIRTNLLPLIGDPRNENKVLLERTQVEAYINAMAKLGELEGLAKRKINEDRLVYRNVTGLDWNELMKKDKYRIYNELTGREDLKPEQPIILNPREIKLPVQFEGLDIISQMILSFDISHMQYDIDSMGFSLGATPILIGVQYPEEAARGSKNAA